MELLQIRRSRQAQRTAERHYYKFIGSYVKAKYNEIFDEAHAMYTDAKAENPGVKDLTKTAFYIRRTQPDDVVVPRYYNNRKLKSSTQECKEPKQMVLNIPLMTISTPTAATATPLPATATATPLTATETAATPTPLQSTPQPPEPLLLSQETYMSLLEDLQKDPDLERILNDFPFDGNMDPFVGNNMEPFVVNDMPCTDQFTPLEVDNNMDGGEDSMDPFVLNDMPWADQFTPLEVDLETTFNVLQ